MVGATPLPRNAVRRLEGSRVLVRLGSVVREYDAADPACGLYEDLRQLILTVAKDYPYLLRH